MRGYLKTFTNAVLVVVGFFAVFFVATKFLGERANNQIAGDSPDNEMDDIDIGVVHADVPTG